MSAAAQATDLPFRVKYFDEKQSKKGKGVQVRRFATVEEAQAFAVGKRLYGKPAEAEWRVG